MEQPKEIASSTVSIYTPIGGVEPPSGEPVEAQEFSWRSYWPLLFGPLVAVFLWWLLSRSKRQKKQRTRFVRSLSESQISIPPVSGDDEGNIWAGEDHGTGPPLEQSGLGLGDTSRWGRRNSSGFYDDSIRGNRDRAKRSIKRIPKPIRPQRSVETESEMVAEERNIQSSSDRPAFTKSRFPFFGYFTF